MSNKHSYDKSKHCVTIDSLRLFLDKNDALNLSQKRYEPLHVKWIKDYVEQGDVVIDVGANIGYYTTILANCVGILGKVYAFEPEPNNFKLLQKNIRANGFNNVIAINAACGRKTGKMTLYVSKPEFSDVGGNGMHRVYPSQFCVDEPIEVDIVEIDNFIVDERDKSHITFVKIDAEGAELDILKGMAGILVNHKHMAMLLEYSPACIREKGDNPHETISILKTTGFHFNRDINGKIKLEKHLDSYIADLNDCQITDTNIKVANFILEK